MHQSTLIKFLDKAHHPRIGETHRRFEGRMRPGLLGLILISLLIITATPVSASESPERLFDTAPKDFSKTSPTDTAPGQATSLTLEWAASKFANFYEYCIDSDLTAGNVGVCNGTWTSTGTNRYVDLTSLTNGTTYEWQVRATNTIPPYTTYANSGTWWTFTTVVTPPEAFSKDGPGDDATGELTSLTLSWYASSGADTYEYCYDSTLDTTCAGSWSSVGDTISVAISGLSYGTQYEWQVRAKNTNPLATYADAGDWWHFTTQLAPPGAFTKSSPETGASYQSVNLTLSWGASSNATGYEYCYEEYDGNSTCEGSWSETTLLYADITLPDYETQYEWQVRATNSSGTTDANGGIWWTFTTGAEPGAFTKYIPYMESINQPTTLVISWAPYAGVTSYDYCLDVLGSGDPDDCNTGWNPNGTVTSKEVNLAYDTEYEWQVRANVGASVFYANAGESPEWWTFTTVVAPPEDFDKTDPDDGVLNQVLSLTLGWEESIGATSYRYCIDSDLDHAGTCNDSWISVDTNSADIAGLTFNTTYEWQVRAFNNNPNYTSADVGAWHQFTTVVAPPGNFFKTSPTDDDVDQPINPTLSWGTSGGATSYEYCYDADIDQTCGYNNDGTWISTGTTKSASPTGLTNGIGYEWQVRAWNANNNPTYANSNTWWTFTTVIAAPGDFDKSSPEPGASDLLPSSVTLEWEESTGAESYWYCIDYTLDDTCNGSWILTDTSTSTSLTDLLFNKTYEWQIRADNANPDKTYADGGAWHNFSTVVAPPGSFNKSSPASGATNQPINLTLDWGDSNAASDFQYCIDAETVPDGTCESGWKSIGGINPSEIALTDLVNDTQYEWQVRADNAYPGETYANSGTWWTFRTIVEKPGAFNKTNPPASATDLLPSSVTLQWETSARATSYSYCVDSTLNATCDESWVSTGTSTIVIPPDLDFNTTYEWQIQAVNANPVKTYANGGVWWQFSTRVGTLPGSFSKQFPLDTSIDQATNPTLQWTAASNATRYEYCIILSPGNCNTWVDNGTSRQVSISGLALNKQYKWQVRAWNDIVGPTYSNSGSYWTFKTVTIEPPGSFGKTTPASGSTGQPLSLTLTWGASANVTTYEYCYDDDPDGSCSSEWKSTTNTSVVISGLAYGIQYEWQVRAFRDGNPNPTFADNGSWWTFSTIVAQPGSFNKSEPINDASDRPTALTLTWGTSSGATSYEYCYEVYDGNDTCAGSWLPAATNSANISGLNYATTYGWQVRASNANPTKTYANAGAWHQFTTIIAPPAGFIKSRPVNEATGQLLNLVLSWNPSSGATSYAYCYDTTVDASCTGTWIATTATSATLSGLNYATVYQWQVRATNATGTTYANAGTLWTFTTTAIPPGAFNKTIPAKGATGQSTTSLTLSWGSSNGMGVTYEYCIDTTLDSVCDGDAWVSTGIAKTAIPVGLTYLTTYQWQVRAVNSNPNPTYANSGTWWLFTTMIPPPNPFSKTSPAKIGSINQPSSQYLTWEPSIGATSYVYCLDIILNDTCDGSGTWKPTNLLYATEPELTYGATYEWQVQAIGNGTTDANAGEWWEFTVKDEPAFSKANPNIGAINQPINNLKITWTDAAGALSYEYCIDSDLSEFHDGVCDASWISTDADTFVTLPALSNNITYEWQVRAVILLEPITYVYANTLESPEWWTFTTVESVPPAFSKSAPANVTTPVQRANNLTLSWGESSGATGYRYCLDTSVNDTCNTSWVTVGTATSVIVSNLEYNKTYQWQVLASNNNPDMTSANEVVTPLGWWTFTTAIAPPDAFAKTSPGDQALDQAINLTLSWGASTGVGLSYEYCIDTTLDSICDGDAWVGPTTLRSANPPGLVNATTYEWQVKAVNANPFESTLANGGIWFEFSTVVAAPQAFSKTGPTNAVSDQPTDLMISWAASAGATGYEYCIDDNPGNSSCDDDWIETSSTQAIITGLINKTQYEWQVRAINANPVIMESDSGTWFTFSTMPLYLYLPYTVSLGLSTPTLNPVTIGPGVNTYTLTWNAVAGATKYKIYESLSDSFTTYVTYDTTSTSLTLPSTLVNPTRYYYRVVAANSLSSGSPSNIVAVDRQYELEDNDSSTTANGQLFFNVTYYFRPDDLKDFFKIYMPGTGTITVMVTGYPLNPLWDGQLQLFEDNTGQLRSWDVRPDLNGMVATWTGTQASWYYILIGTDPASWNSDWYTFTVTYTP
jgi:hypothetical protein